MFSKRVFISIIVVGCLVQFVTCPPPTPAVKSAPPPAKSAPPAVKSAPPPAKSAPSAVKSAPPPAKSAPSAAKSAPPAAKSSPPATPAAQGKVPATKSKPSAPPKGKPPAATSSPPSKKNPPAVKSPSPVQPRGLPVTSKSGGNAKDAAAKPKTPTKPAAEAPADQNDQQNGPAGDIGKPFGGLRRAISSIRRRLNPFRFARRAYGKTKRAGSNIIGSMIGVLATPKPGGPEQTQ